MINLDSRIHQFVLKRRVKNFRLIRVLYKIGNIYETLFHKYENTKTKSTRHHSVPQFWLKRFKVGLPHCNNCLYVINTKTQTVHERAKSITKELGATYDLYDVRDKSGSHSDYIDQKIYRSRMEAYMSIVVRDFEKKLTYGLTYAEEITINNFIGHQITRTNHFRKCLETYIYCCIQSGLIDRGDLNRESLPEEIVTNSFNLDIQDLIQFKRHVDPEIVEGERAKGMITHLCLQMSDAVCRSIWGFNFQLMKMPEGEVLISDNPVVSWDLKNGVQDFVEWWDLKNKQLFIPLSDSELLIVTKDIPKEVVDKDFSTTKPFAELSNYGQFITSSSEVYGKDREKLTAYNKLFRGK